MKLLRVHKFYSVGEGIYSRMMKLPGDLLLDDQGVKPVRFNGVVT